MGTLAKRSQRRCRGVRKTARAILGRLSASAAKRVRVGLVPPVVAIGFAVLTAMPLTAQSPSPSGPTRTDSARSEGDPAAAAGTKPTQPGPWNSSTNPPAPEGSTHTTIVPRSSAGGGPIAATLGEVRLVAHLTDDGQPIEQGLVWHIFEAGPASSTASPAKLVRTLREASPLIRLAPGPYLVNVSFGRANLTQSVKVEAGKPMSSRFVLNAGGLRISAQTAGGQPAPEGTVSFDVMSGETDQLGNRQRVVAAARPGLILRLNAGIYRVVSTLGDANAVVRSDVSVEAGKLTEATITHHGADVTFKLVTRAGGEAQSGAEWSILDAAGAVIKSSAGALPRHILAAGSYVVTARHGGRTFRRGFTVQPGEPLQVEVVMH